MVSVLVCKAGKMVPTSNGGGGVGKSGVCRGRSLNTSSLSSPLSVPSEPHAPAGNKQQLWPEGWRPALLERRGVEQLRPAVLGHPAKWPCETPCRGPSLVEGHKSATPPPLGLIDVLILLRTVGPLLGVSLKKALDAEPEPSLKCAR